VNFSYLRNSGALLEHGHVALRRDALSILDRVLAQVDPFEACRKTVRFVGESIEVGGLKLHLAADARIWFFGAGKASLSIARAIEHQLGERVYGGLVVCKEGQEGSLSRIEVLHASHPVPSAASVDAARRMLGMAALPKPGDVVICGITGGSSALLTLPCSDLALADVQSLTKILLTCGADIFEINAVRKHLSEVGGGRLAQQFHPAVQLVNITVSDVIGDALDYITDPTVPDTSSVEDARATFNKYALWNRVPPGIAAFLKPGGKVAETPKRLPWSPEHTRVLLSASSPADVAHRVARELGYTPIVLSTSFDGESQALGQTFSAIAREVASRGQPVAPPCALIGGGETIVKMDGFAGLGGPNQEFALAGACHLPAGRPAVLLGADSDGTDGPTEVAGALCDTSTLARAKARGIDLENALSRHDVTPALISLGDAIITGATGTNVNDLKLLLMA
jgi:glycerate-2-kinase